MRNTPYIEIEPAGCRNPQCENFNVDISKGKSYYSKFGKNKAGSPRYKCKSCGKTFAINTKPHSRQFKSHVNKLVFKAFVNKSPIQRIADIAEIDPRAVLDKIDFIYKQCVLFSRHKESILLHQLENKKLRLSTDSQSLLINWTLKADKRNTQLQSIATACNESGFIFRADLNYQPEISHKEVEELLEKYSEHQEEPAFRKTARFWTKKP